MCRALCYKLACLDAHPHPLPMGVVSAVCVFFLFVVIRDTCSTTRTSSSWICCCFHCSPDQPVVPWHFLRRWCHYQQQDSSLICSICLLLLWASFSSRAPLFYCHLLLSHLSHSDRMLLRTVACEFLFVCEVFCALYIALKTGLKKKPKKPENQ